MKNKIILYGLLSFILAFNANAQIEKEILSYTDSTELIINKGRKMLLHNIAENNDKKAKEIYRYLSSLDYGRSFSAFYYTEDLYVNILIGDWTKVADHMIHYQERFFKNIYPSSVNLTPLLYRRVSEKTDSLSKELQESDLDSESKQVILLLLKIIEEEKPTDEYTVMLRDFWSKHGNSKYEAFLKGFMPGKKLKGSFCFSFGSGMIFPTSELANNFNKNANFNMSMDINIQKVYTSLYMMGGSLKLQNPFSAITDVGSMNFLYDESFQYFEGGLKAGYFILRNNRLHLAPYGSLSGSSLKSSRFDTEEEGNEYEIFNSFSYGCGIHTEFKITDFTTKNMYGTETQSFISLKLEGGYKAIANFNNRNFEGNTTYFTVAFVWGLGEF